MPRRPAPLAALTAVAVLALVGCASTAPTGGDEDAALHVVASTSVYGQIAEAIGGDAVEVTALVASSSQDPHAYEPSAQDTLAISRADLILENGGGYDGFIDALIESSGTDAPVLTAAEFSHDWPENAGHEEESEHADEEHDHDHEADGHDHVEGFNEHVWYDPHTIAHFAEAIAAELAELDPSQEDAFTARAAEFAAGIDELEGEISALAAAHAGAAVFVTEPVPLYLVAAAELRNVTPEAFTEAVEEGQDVPPATLLEALGLLEGGDVRATIVNAQTGGAETAEIAEASSAAGIPVVEFAETLPEGQTYLSWMHANVAALAAALGR